MANNSLLARHFVSKTHNWTKIEIRACRPIGRASAQMRTYLSIEIPLRYVNRGNTIDRARNAHRARNRTLNASSRRLYFDLWSAIYYNRYTAIYRLVFANSSKLTLSGRLPSADFLSSPLATLCRRESLWSHNCQEDWIQSLENHCSWWQWKTRLVMLCSRYIKRVVMFKNNRLNEWNVTTEERTINND